MRLTFLTALTMLAFAANSILNRMALAGGHIDAFSFSIVRVVAGAGVLVALTLISGRSLPGLTWGRVLGAASLALYLVGFSAAYIRLNAGLGALILFGVVQITMFAGAVIGGNPVGRNKWIGAGIALAGLTWLLAPTGAVQVSVFGAICMGGAGAGWGLYSLAGRSTTDPLAATAANFLWAIPLCVAAMAVFSDPQSPAHFSSTGIWLALVSGALTSGLGYALWYMVLPRLEASVAGLVQLSVPVIAVLAGAFILGETLNLRLVGAGAVVMTGIGFALLAPQLTSQRKMGSSGS